MKRKILWYNGMGFIQRPKGPTQITAPITPPPPQLPGSKTKISPFALHPHLSTSLPILIYQPCLRYLRYASFFHHLTLLAPHLRNTTASFVPNRPTPTYLGRYLLTRPPTQYNPHFRGESKQASRGTRKSNRMEPRV